MPFRGLHADFPDQALTGPGGTPSQYYSFREKGQKSVLLKINTSILNP